MKQSVLTTNIWRAVIGAIIAILLSVGGWVIVEVRGMPATYATIEKHDKDIDSTQELMREQQTRIEDKIDETNRFLRDHFSRTNP